MNKLTASEKIDIKMMQNPDEWPKWPFLPMKRHGEKGIELGLWVEQANNFYFLRGANIWDGESIKNTRPEEITAEELVQQGWKVD